MTQARLPLNRPAPIVKALLFTSKCEICGQVFKARVSSAELAGAAKYPFCHLILHGSPIHALAIYVDSNGSVRATDSSKSIQIDRTSATFQELVRWWGMHAEDDG
nr:hypothetical protein [Candidatus Sigynarchaeota archaeon]